MSFILDALKKSEAERQRKSVPGFADIPNAHAAPRPQRWWWAIGALLTVNLLVLLVVIFRGSETQSVAPVTVQESVAATNESRVERPFADIVAEAKKNRPEREPPTTTEPLRPVAPAAERSPADAAPRQRETDFATTSESLSTLDELRANGTLQLPELHLDIHVYSEQAAERFVFINMSKYQEDAALAEGPIVKEIMPEGVVLEHRGTRFLMPRR
jgi:general secretion pathway protein B